MVNLRNTEIDSMTSPVTPGTANLLVRLGVNPTTPKKPPKSPASIAERAEQTALRKRELEAAAETDAADQALEACEMMVADPSAAPALKAAAKKARLYRKQATQDACAKAQDAAAMPPPPKPGTQAKAGKDKKKPAGAAAARIGSRKRRPPRPLYPRTTRTLTSVRGQTRVRRHPPGQGTPRWAPPPAPLHTAHLPCLLTPAPHKPPQTANTKHKPPTTSLIHGLPWSSLIPRSNSSWTSPARKKNPGPGYPAP